VFTLFTRSVWLRLAGLVPLAIGGLSAQAQVQSMPWPLVREYTYCSQPYIWKEDSTAACVAAAADCALAYQNAAARMVTPPATPGSACVVEIILQDGGVGWRGEWTALPRDVCGYGTALKPGLGRDYPTSTSDCLLAMSVPRPFDPPNSCPADPRVANPIHPLRGVKREVVDTGLTIGRLNLQFTYDTSSKIPRLPERLAEAGSNSQQTGVLGSLLWSSNLHRRVNLARAVSGAPTTLPVPTIVDRGNGIAKTWTSTNQGPQVAEPGNADRLAGLPGGGFLYVDAASKVQETYTTQGSLTSMAWSDGVRVDFNYDGTGLLTQATDNTGRTLTFSYVAGSDLVSRVSTITDASGAVTSLTYDSHGNLAAMGWPDGRSRRFVYGIRGKPWALTGIEDERGVRYASFGYDSEGRVISSEHAGGTQRYSVSYTVPPSIQVTEETDGNYVLLTSAWNAPQGIVVTGPDGGADSWGVTSLNSKNFFTGQSQRAGAGCAASASGQSYDANGNLAGKDDFNGTRSCRAHDLSRNLQTVEVEGLSQSASCGAVLVANASLPANSRKTSTQWHPDWSLPVKVATPGKLTTNVYNGQPDPFNGNALASCAPAGAVLPDGKPIAVLCKTVEQSTTDVDGHLGFSAALQAGVASRVTSWTYNERGQVLTAKRPMTAVNATTTYTYYTDTTADHTVGDLKTTTNAVGKVTTYGKYNKVGRLLQSTDPNGQVTVNTYDARQRLLTSSVAGETTTYAYDEVGQLLQVTQADGSWVGYEYDDAHRQTVVKDNLGNRIQYTLDNNGKRLSDEVKDPSGSLRRSLVRVRDALGREQQLTGRE